MEARRERPVCEDIQYGRFQDATKDYEELDEGVVLAELVEYLVNSWGTDRDETNAAVEAWKAAVGASAGARPATRVQPMRSDGEETEAAVSASDSEGADLDMPLVELGERREMRKLEQDRDSGFIIVYNRLSKGMLHKSGSGGCWMARRREFRRCEFYDVEPPEEEYTGRCKV